MAILGDQVLLYALVQALFSLLVLLHLGLLVLQLFLLLLGFCGGLEQGQFRRHRACHLPLLDYLLGHVGIVIEREGVVDELGDDGG